MNIHQRLKALRKANPTAIYKLDAEEKRIYLVLLTPYLLTKDEHGNLVPVSRQYCVHDEGEEINY